MKHALLPIRKRIRFLRTAKGFSSGLFAGVSACCLLLIVSFLLPIETIWIYLLALLLGFPFVCALVGLLLPISTNYAASVADSCGLQERVLTALAFTQEKSPMHQLQREDAETKLRSLPIRQSLPVKPNRNLLTVTASITIACAILLLVPNPQHDVLRAKENMRAKLHTQADTIEKAAESLDTTKMSVDEQKELRRITSEMVQELRTAKDVRDALVGMDKVQSEMDKLQQQIKQRQISEAAAPLASQPALKSLADAMTGGDTSQMDQALAELAEMLSNAEKKEEIQNQLGLASELADATLQQALADAASMLNSNNAAGAMQALSNYLRNSQNTSGDLESLMQIARLGAAQAGSSSGNAAMSANGMGYSSKAGLGTTQFDQGYKEASSQSSGAFGTGPIQEKVGQYEQIYDPSRLGGDNEASLSPGEKNEGDSQQMTLGPGMGSFSGAVPYNQVIGTYQEAAAQAMNRIVLPAVTQDWVTRYFDSLIP